MMRIGSSKGQLLTLVMLVIFILLLAELFAFALLNIGANNIAQSLTVASTSANYGSTLKLSANNFAAASLSKAITTLSNYEFTPPYRKGNFITNASLYLSYLVTNGILPNDTSGYPQNAMGNLTLKSYNATVANVIGVASQSVTVNETQPLVFQTDPYHLRMAYTERLAINSSGSNYKYTIPVNVSLPLNGTPDLFYSQQGIASQITFGSLANITIVVGGVSATSGNLIAYGYGTVYWLSSSSTSGASCSSIPAAISAASESGNIVLATYNAIGLESCENSYAGLITYTAPTTLPTVAYLIYPSSTNLLQLIPSGTKVLVYGPSLETLNIEGLKSAIANGYYFVSPFTASYLDRAVGNFNKQSPNGVFTFSNYNTQSGNFIGASSNVLVSRALVPYGTTTFSESAWVNLASLPSGSGTVELAGEGAGSNCATGSIYCLEDSATYNVIFGFAGCGSIYTLTPVISAANTWYNVVAVFNSLGTSSIYINGKQYASGSFSLCNHAQDFQIGSDGGGDVFSGKIANVQVYSTALSGVQASQIYQEGISNLPTAYNSLIGWWQLNGNAQDYGGESNNGIASGVTYMLLPGYTRDSILNIPIPTATSPILGVLSCTSTANCGSSTAPQLYIGYMPLQAQSGTFQTGNFNGASSNVMVSTSPIGIAANTFSESSWVNFASLPGSGSVEIAGEGASGGCSTSGVYCLQYSSSGYFSFGGGTAIHATSTPGTNTWYNIIAVFNSIGVNTVYINGVPSATGVVSLQSTATNLQIGSDASSDFFPGKISNLQLYGSALTAAQANQIYSSGIAGIPVSSTKIIGWWPLNGDANDYSGQGKNGIANNLVYPYFAGTYNSPGLSTIAVSTNEWQALGLVNT